VIDVNQIADTLQSTPGVLRAMLEPFDQATLALRPAEGEWCPLEVIGHLIACDSAAFRDRITGIVTGLPEIASFDAWEAINARDFATQTLDELLNELTDERAVSADLLRGLSRSTWPSRRRTSTADSRPMILCTSGRFTTKTTCNKSSLR